MELNKIEILTEKYLNAETSIEEEQVLREYYTSGKVAPHLEEYVPMFSYFTAQKEIKYSKEENFSSRKKRTFYEWSAVAASIAIIAGVFLYNDHQAEPDLGTYEDPQVALQKTINILNTVSLYMNEGQQKLNYMSEFGETTDRIIKTQ